jgi:hypothetical protein
VLETLAVFSVFTAFCKLTVLGDLKSRNLAASENNTTAKRRKTVTRKLMTTAQSTHDNMLASGGIRSMYTSSFNVCRKVLRTHLKKLTF